MDEDTWGIKREEGMGVREDMEREDRQRMMEWENRNRRKQYE